MKILFVDDNLATTEMMKTYFKNKDDEHYEIETAKNGAEALSIYQQFKPNVVILDLAMPVMDGKEALIHLKKMDPTAYIFIASSSGSSSIVNECLNKGANGFIEKPYSPSKLLELINNTMKKGTDYSNQVTLFVNTGKKIQESLQVLLDSSFDVSLENIDVIDPVISKAPTYDNNFSTILQVSSIEEQNIIIPTSYCTFVFNVSGQKNGVIVSSIKKQDLDILLHSTNKKIPNEKSFTQDLFNICIHKIVTELVEYTNTRIQLSVPHELSNEENVIEAGDKQKTILTYAISAGKQNIIWNVYICLI